MKYLLLVHHSEEVLDRLGDIELARLMDESIGLTHQLHAKRQYIDAAPLQPTPTATSVRVRDGKRLVTDGPFAETKEQLGGYFLVEASDMDGAIGIAARIPGGRIGTVEIRQVMEIPGLPAN